SCVDDRVDRVLEKLRVGHSSDHESGKKLARVDKDKLSGFECIDDLKASYLQTSRERPSTRLFGNGYCGLAGRQCAGQEVAYYVTEKIVVLIKLNNVITLGGTCKEALRGVPPQFLFSGCLYHAISSSDEGNLHHPRQAMESNRLSRVTNAARLATDTLV